MVVNWIKTTTWNFWNM